LTTPQNIYPPPPTTILYGLDGTNKLDLITSVLTSRKLPNAIVKCRECLSQRHLLSKIFTSCARALDRAEAVELYERVENINGLLVNLERLCRNVKGRSVVLVLDAVDELRGAGGTLLAALARLGDLVRDSLAIILHGYSDIPKRQLSERDQQDEPS
jgi:origin recognition complex subunit 5